MIAQQVKQATWNQVRRFLGAPGLNEPEFAEEGMEDEIAGISMKSKNIRINERNLERRIGSDLLRPVEGHEVEHYRLCPYSLRNYVRLVAHADSVLGSIEDAKLVENLFSDLLCNYDLFRKGERSIAAVYDRLSMGGQPSKSWDFYIETFAGMIGKRTTRTSLNEKQRDDAKKLSDILKDSAYNSKKWPDSIKEFAKAIKEYLDKESQSNAGGSSGSAAGKGGKGSSAAASSQPKQGKHQQNNTPRKAPLIDSHDVKDFLPYSPDKATPDQQKKFFQKELSGLGNELGQDQYKRVLAGLGIGTDRQTTIWFYRDLVKSYALKMPDVTSRSGDRFKETPVRCELERVHEADIEYSLSQYPFLNPAFLYRWSYAEGISSTFGKDNPDLLIAIDSSGSMDNPSESLSYALLSAMIAKKTALDAGCQVGVINFSSRSECVFQDFTYSNESLDDALSHYFGGGTEIPGEQMLEAVRGHKRPTHILVITDTQIANLDAQAGYLADALATCKAGGSIFLSTSPGDETRLLKKIGYDVIPTRSFSDLDDLTIKKSGEIYAT
ncbi:VWA domain-containing protein [Candidatus Woesearchaeota archaeon]|nr:VWA domain-containing protein [Candidatus Woesearchaeota archaeon]